MNFEGKIRNISLYLIYFFFILLFFNLNAFTGNILRPEIPYFSHERIISGLAASLLIALVFGAAFIYIRRLEKNICKLKQVERQLRDSEDKYSSLVDSTEDSIYLVDNNYRYLFMNKKHRSRLAVSDDKYCGSEFSEFHSPMETRMFMEKADKVLQTGESVSYEYKSLRDGKYFLQTFSPVKDDGGQTIAVTIISKNITKLKQMEKELIYLSNTDELTGLYNRRGFFSLMEHRLQLAKREKCRLMLLYADVDNFKSINDTYGHHEGDSVLIDIARILRSTYRESDIIARMGGDEFVVFPIGATTDHIDTIIARIQNNLNDYNSANKRDFNLSLSFGVSTFDPEGTRSVDDLLAQADRSMYTYKRENSHRY